MIDWNKRNGGFLSPESVYEDQLGNLSMQINQKDKEIEKLRHIKKQLEKNLQIYMQKDAKNQLKIEKAIQREIELSYLCGTSPDEELLNILKDGDDNK